LGKGAFPPSKGKWGEGRRGRQTYIPMADQRNKKVLVSKHVFLGRGRTEVGGEREKEVVTEPLSLRNVRLRWGGRVGIGVYCPSGPLGGRRGKGH